MFISHAHAAAQVAISDDPDQFAIGSCYSGYPQTGAGHFHNHFFYRLIGFYLGRGSVTSAYGAAGSLVALLLWIYYSAQIFFLGAEFTYIQARRQGPRAEPARGAVRDPQLRMT